MKFWASSLEIAELLDYVQKRTLTYYYVYLSIYLSPSDYTVQTRAKAQSAEFGQKQVKST